MQSAAGLKKTHKASAAPPPPKCTIISLAFTLHPLNGWLIWHHCQITPQNFKSPHLQHPYCADRREKLLLEDEGHRLLTVLPLEGQCPCEHFKLGGKGKKGSHI